MKELTRDHFSPRCIFRELTKITPPEFMWTLGDVNQVDNIQFLPWSEHAKKDATTPWELQAVLRNGGAKTLWEHYNEGIILRNGNPNA